MAHLSRRYRIIMGMNLAHALRATHASAISFVGAGGKSTAMFQLAREIRSPVILTATTHLGIWQTPLADRHIIATTPGQMMKGISDVRGVTLITGPVKGDKSGPLEDKVLDRLHQYCTAQSIPLLVEADGSRQKPIKAPGEHEPPIPEFSNLIVVVTGLSGIGSSLGEDSVHRSEIFSNLSGLALDERISHHALLRVLNHPQGGLKNIPDSARRVALLNQADTPALQAGANEIAERLLPAYDSVVIASLAEQTIHAVREPIAGIILAAGESRRFGQPKQLLDWRGEPFVRAVAQVALSASLSPLVLVTGAHGDQIAAAVADLPLQIILNPDWLSGQASSIQRGLSSLLQTRPHVGGAVFLLADQPQVTSAILRALCEQHSRTLAPITAPMIIDRRGNPVLFDRSTFLDLQTLEGDIGGRAIFSKHKVSYLPWHDESLLLDVDSPGDYRRLQELWE